MRKRSIFTWPAIIVSLIVVMATSTYAAAEPKKEISPKERCPVCGMFVAKYKPWLAQTHMEDGTTAMFDGVKDMMAYYFEPQKYGGKSTVKEIYVTDYYTQKMIDGMKALYVIGSDVLGPMGHELIPLSSREAAETFLKDHKGDKILLFNEIDLKLINSMRSAHGGKMMHKSTKSK